MSKRKSIVKRQVKRGVAATSPFMTSYTKVTGALPPMKPVSAAPTPPSSPTPIVRTEPTPAQNMMSFKDSMVGAMKGAGGWIQEQAKGGLKTQSAQPVPSMPSADSLLKTLPGLSVAYGTGEKMMVRSPGSAAMSVGTGLIAAKESVGGALKGGLQFGASAKTSPSESSVITTGSTNDAISRAVAAIPAPEKWGTKESTGWITGVNPSMDMAHLAPGERHLTVAPTGRIYGGKKSSVDYLATSMDPAAVAWRARREAEGKIDTLKEAGPVGTVPGYRFIPDYSSQEASVQSIMKMPKLQAEAILSGKEPKPPGFKGEGVDIFGGPTPTYDMFGGALVKSKNIAGVTSQQRTGRKKKQIAKRKFPVVSVPGFKMDIPEIKGFGLNKKKKK